MLNGEIIPGSKFSDVFNDGIGFWGYQSSEKTNSYFSIDLNERVRINKVFLGTNNFISVDLYIKENHDKEWIKIDTREGIKHVWNFYPQYCVSLKFESNTDLFSVTKIQAGLASYQKNGVLETEYYTVRDLYRLKLTANAEVPENTGIDFGILIENQTEEYPISDDVLITGGVIWHEASGILPTGILPSGYVEDSLTVKSGYNEWETIDTYDYTWVAEEENPSGSGEIQFSTEYRVIEGSLQRVSLGNTVFSEGVDYSADYSEISSRKVTITLLENTNIPTAEIGNLNCSLLVRKREQVRQIRTYIDLDYDEDIIVQGFNVPFNIRHVVIKDEIIRDTTQEINTSNLSVLLEDIESISSYVIKGLAGTNLIEIEPLEGSTFPPPVVINGLDYFARRYNLIETSDVPDDTEYNLVPVLDPFGIPLSYNVVPGPSGVLWMSYAESIINSSGILDSRIKLRSTFISTDGGNTPTLRYYKLLNHVK